MHTSTEVTAPLRRNWFHILLAVSRGAAHGYAIRKEVAEHTQGELTLWPATLYGTLQDMDAAGLLVDAEDSSEGGRERRSYRMTETGRAALAAETERLAALVDLARAASES